MKALLTTIALTFFSANLFSQDCLDLSQYDQQYLDSVNALPPGSTLFSEGDLALIRPDQFSQYQFMQGDTLMYVGNLEVNTSASSCVDKILSFSCVYLEGLAVDGDTIFSSLNPPSFYQGAGWEFEAINNGTFIEYVIIGDFDEAYLFTQTNFIWDICLECASLPVSNCLDLGQYDQQYLDSVNSLPPGSILFQEGDLSLIRPDQFSQYQFMQGDTLMYIGNLEINTSASNCVDKILSFSCVYLEGLAVDGDTIFSALNPPMFYQGAGWEFEAIDQGTYMEYVITGDFDEAYLFTQTNFIWDICLECGTLSLDPIEIPTNFEIYPNPADQWVTLSGAGEFEYAIVSMNGSLITKGSVQGEGKIDVSAYLPGLYLVQVIDSNGRLSVSKLQVK